MLSWLATGGMSELYLARQAGPSGFQRVVVLKVILPHLAEDRELVQNFENEAKVAALLNHPNVVQISDFGSEQGLYYLTMEYIDGQPLSRLFRELNSNGQIMPVALACRLVSEATAGLAYAHDLEDARGERLQVIHRDVSLENILLSYAGQVKVVDFGLAKARTLVSLTRHGTLKGKCRYMAPEMISGEAIDHRVDIFALGVVLFALTTGKMPFDGHAYHELLIRIVREPPPAPRSINPRIPVEIEEIILRALEKDPAQRYPHASELQKDLESYLMRTSSLVAPYQLAQFMRTVFPPGTDEVREAYQKLAGVAAAPSDDLVDAPTLLESPSIPRVRESDSQVSTAGTQRFEPAREAAPETVSLAETTEVFAAAGPSPSASTVILAPVAQAAELGRSPPSRVLLGLAGAGAALLFLGGAVLYLWIQTPPAVEASHLDAAMQAALAPRTPDAAPNLSRTLDAAPETARDAAPRAAQTPDAAPLPRLARPKSTRGRLTILVWPYGTVTLDGKALGATPLPTQILPEGRHQLVVENRELGQKRTMPVQVRAGRETVVKVKLQP